MILQFTHDKKMVVEKLVAKSGESKNLIGERD